MYDEFLNCFTTDVKCLTLLYLLLQVDLFELLVKESV